MNKRGISAVVATVLIILLVLVSVSVVWIGVRPLISGTSEQITAECLTLNIEPVTCSTNQQGETTVRVRRNAGQGSLSEIRFLFDREENPVSLTKPANINELETMAFTFNNSEVSNPEFIEIAAIIDDANVCNPVPRKISCRQENPPLPLSCPFGNNITNYQTCDYRFMQQDKYSSINLSKYGMNNHSLSISGHWLLAGVGQDLGQFLAATETQIENRLNQAISATPGLDPNTDEYIILDMEHPVNLKDLGNHYLNISSEGQFEEIVKAFKLRISVARETFPNAKLALYGTIIPPIQGDDQRQDFQNSMLGYVEAGKLGLYDEIDYLNPILYTRFGPSDFRFNTIENSTIHGIEYAMQLKRTNGDLIPLAPLLGLHVLNGNSNHHEEMADINTTLRIIEITQSYPEVEIISFWTATDVWHDINAEDFFDQLKPVPSSCFCGL